LTAARVAGELGEGSCTRQGWRFCLSGQSAGGRWVVAVGFGSGMEPEMAVAFVIETATVVVIVIAGTEIVTVLAVGKGFVCFGNFQRDWNTQVVLGIAPEVAIAGPV
jgi:hypothetical protein